MLSKEEIEFNLKVVSNVMLNFEDELCDKMQERIKEIKEYIKQLETREQKLIEKLEEEIKEEREIMKPLEHKSMAFHYANGRETLAQDILEILKGEEK